MAIVDLLTLMAGLWLVASSIGLVLLAAIYVAERARKHAGVSYAATEAPALETAKAD
jgi:hypothetical protein